MFGHGSEYAFASLLHPQSKHLEENRFEYVILQFQQENVTIVLKSLHNILIRYYKTVRKIIQWTYIQIAYTILRRIGLNFFWNWQKC